MAKQRRSFGQKRGNSKKEIFVGREVQVQKFQENVKLDPYDDDFQNIINVFGQGGVGKTTLLNKYLSICKSVDYCVSFINTEDANIYEVTETMNFIANALEQQGLSFKRFAKGYKIYLQEKGKLEAAPNKPKGTLGKLVKAGIKIGSEVLPGGRRIFDTSIIDSAAEIASEWLDFVANNISNKDEIELVLHPLKVLTPLWIEDLYEASEKKKLALFFDSFEESNPELEKWLLDLLEEKYGPMPSILLVIGGRNALTVEKWNEFATFTYQIKLEVFSSFEAKNYLEQKGITNSILSEQLLSISGRLPVYLSLLAEGSISDFDEIYHPSEKIVNRFLRHIDNPIHVYLSLYASLPNQLNESIVECLLPDQEKLNTKFHFDWLKTRPFIEKRNNYWMYNVVVREIMQRHLKESSKTDWEKYHNKLADWYKNKSIILEARSSNDRWFEDENWKTILFEKHFHLLSANYQEHLSGLIRDFVSLLFHVGYSSTIPLINILMDVEKILDIQNRLGEILLKGNNGLINGKEEDVLEVFSIINQIDCIIQEDEKSFMFYAQGVLEPNLDQAIECYQQALEIKPDFYDALYNIGVAYSAKGEQDKAIIYYQKTVEINPGFHKAFHKMGIAYSAKGEQDQAIGCYQKALEVKPDFHEALYNTGVAYSAKGDQNQAILYFQKALEVNPDFYKTLDLSYLKRKNEFEANPLLKEKINEEEEKRVKVEIILDEDFENFTSRDVQDFIKNLYERIKFESLPEVKEITKGSVRIVLEMNEADANELIAMVITGKFTKKNLISAKLIKYQNETNNVSGLQTNTETLTNFKNTLKKCMASKGLPKAIETLEPYLILPSETYDQLVLLKTSLFEIKQLAINGILNLDQISQKQAFLNTSFLALINNIEFFEVNLENI